MRKLFCNYWGSIFYFLDFFDFLDFLSIGGGGLSIPAILDNLLSMAFCALSVMPVLSRENVTTPNNLLQG